MSLQGSLDTFALTDVLVLLASTKKDGELKVKGARGEGKIWVDKGEIVQAAIGTKAVPAVDAVFELLRMPEGNFVFEAGSAAPKAGEPESIDLVLADSQARLAEWRDIEKVVPHLDCMVAMAAEAPGDSVVVSAEQWRLLASFGDGHSVRELMERRSLGEFDASKVVKELVESGLATLQTELAPAKAAAPKVKAPEPAPAPAPKAEEQPKAEEAKPAEQPKADETPKIDGPADELAARARKVRATTSSPDGAAPQPPHPQPASSSASRRKPGGVDEAKALVAQLAALSGEAEEEVAEKVAHHLAEGGELPPGVAEGDDTINRGLLLKFLSSVRN